MANRIPKSSGRATTEKEGESIGLGSMYSSSAEKYAEFSPALNKEIGPAAPGQDLQRADAFRHAYSAAIVTREIGQALNNLNIGNSEWGREAAMATAAQATSTMGRGLEQIAVLDHGTKDRNHADIGMDLHNNQRGIEIAKQLGMNASNDQIAAAVVKDMARGNMILSNEDPRAQANFDKQLDMKTLQAGRDGATTAGAFVASAWDSAKDAGQQVVAKLQKDEKTKESTLDATAQAFKNPSPSPHKSPAEVDKALDAINSTSPFTSQSSKGIEASSKQVGPAAASTQSHDEKVQKSNAKAQEQAMSMGE